MLDPRQSTGQTPHRLTLKPTGAADSKAAEQVLFNLASLNPARQAHFGTARMIRIYRQEGATVAHKERIDWEIERPVRESSDGGAQAGEAEIGRDDEGLWMPAGGALEDSKLHGFIHRQGAVAAVIIKDLRKGVISKPLIRYLAEQFPGADWFVSSKAWLPSWFEALPTDQVRLLLVPQIAAQDAVRRDTLSRWLTRPHGPSPGEASRGGLEELDKLGRRFPGAIIVALPEGLSLLARETGKGEAKRKGLLQTEEGPTDLVATMPMASVFLPAMVARQLQSPKLELELLLKASLEFTHRWMADEFERVKQPEAWKPTKERALNLSAAPPTDSAAGDRKVFDGSWRPFEWTCALDDWIAAFKNCGVIDSERKSKDGSASAGTLQKRLELWRAMTEVDGYVCCSTNKRQVVRNLLQELKAFDTRGRNDHISCMLIAQPGSGKTHLVRRMAEAVGLRFLGFNITQMIPKTDLLDCFDTIVTNQAQSREKPLLVFVDEINALLGGQHVYDTFLAPLEEHVYVRAGKTFHIDPCVWVFAGTERPSSTGRKGRDRSEKAADFENRLTLEPQDLKAGDPGEEQVEHVYLGAALLRNAFPDVRQVSEKVLKVFFELKPELVARDIRHFVDSGFTGIQYGKVTSHNIVHERLKNVSFSITKWMGYSEGEMVEIVG